MKDQKSKYIAFLSLAIMLSSCCYTSDSRIPDGLSSGDERELNFYELPQCPLDSNSFGTFRQMQFNTITDSATCDSLAQTWNNNTPCTICNGIDFNKNIIVLLRGHLDGTSDIDFKPRVTVNFKNQTYSVELRGSATSCHTYYGRIDRDFGIYQELLVIPKPPANYDFNIRYINPVGEGVGF